MLKSSLHLYWFGAVSRHIYATRSNLACIGGISREDRAARFAPHDAKSVSQLKQAVPFRGTYGNLCQQSALLSPASSTIYDNVRRTVTLSSLILVVSYWKH